MKKIRLHRIAIAAGLIISAGVTLSSCNKFLDIRPVGELTGERLFSKEKGFQDAIYGVYATLAKESLYGGTLSHGMLDLMAQYFVVPGGQDFVTQVTEYNYRNSTVETKIDAVWLSSYNCIAALNSVLNQLEEHSEEDLRLYRIYKGEALGLRAFLHFDLLRLFSEQIDQNPAAEGIPYSTDFSDRPGAILPASEVYKRIIADLEEAEQLLSDEEQSFGLDPAEEGDTFLNDRETHFNLHAVRATLARVYFTMGDKAKAAEYARKVVESGKFALMSSSQLSSGKVRGILYPGETIFGLYSEAHYTTVHDLFLVQQSYSSYDPRADIKSFYEKEQRGHDYRWEGFFQAPTSSGGSMRFVKLVDYYQAAEQEYLRPEGDILGITMIRLPEMYYILAESLLESDPTAARDYFDKVLTARGLTPLSNREDAAEQTLTLERITEERYKEMIGEGQSFFNMKRLHLDIYTTRQQTLPADKSIYVWPIPNDEREFNQTTTEQ